MTSFAVRIEPAVQPRLAAAVFLLHACAALLPWIAGCRPGVAAVASLLALGGLPWSLAAVPGAPGSLRRLDIDPAGCRVWTVLAPCGIPARLGPRCRVFSGLVALDLRSGGGRLAWLLPRAALAPAEFRRLKARVRLAC